MQHSTVEAAGARFHVVTAGVTTGSGPALLLLHGWPEYWRTWEPVMQRLSQRFTLIAPDLRGFGESSKPAGPWGAEDHARDILALLDAMGTGPLGIGPLGVAGHDVGGSVMLQLARLAPGRFAGLFLFGFSHPGIGTRGGTPDRLNEIWYQSFHQMPMAAALVGASRDTCRAYIGHFLRHWAHRKDAFDDVLEDWVDNFLRPGNLQGGFDFYRAAHAGRVAILSGTAPAAAPIHVPTCVRWGADDPVFPSAWTDRLGELFTDLDLAILPGIGHFPHREDPDLAASEIAAFFTRIRRN